MKHRITDKEMGERRVAEAIEKHKFEFEKKKQLCPYSTAYEQAYSPIEFGKKVSSRRNDLDMSQKYCAKESGMTSPMLSRIESGGLKGVIKQDSLYLLCVTLDCTPDYLLGITESPELWVHTNEDGSQTEVKSPFAYREAPVRKLTSKLMWNVVDEAIRKTYIDRPDDVLSLIAVLESQNPKLLKEFYNEVHSLCDRYDLCVRQFDGR